MELLRSAFFEELMESESLGQETHSHEGKAGTLWWFNIAMENGPCVGDLPIQIVIFHSYVSHWGN